VSVTSGGAVVGPPKSGKGRDVPVPRFVLEQLPVAGRKPGEWLFTGARGGRIDPHNWRRRPFRPAAKEAGLGDLHPHALRHTAASLAIATGADVMVVQRMLGHASAAITLSIYSHLWDQGLDRVAERMHSAGAPRLTETIPSRGCETKLQPIPKHCTSRPYLMLLERSRGSTELIGSSLKLRPQQDRPNSR
jgi:hypothetical protein